MVTLLDEFDTAELLKLTPRQVLHLAKSGQLPAVYLPGGAVRFDSADLGHWVQSHKRPESEGAV